MESFTKSPEVESEPIAYDREATAVQAMTEARRLLSEKLDWEKSTSSEKSDVLNELFEELDTPPLDNSKRHVAEALSKLKSAEEMKIKIENTQAEYNALMAQLGVESKTY